MAIDKLVDSGLLNTGLSNIANAIREKGGTSSPLTFPDGFVEAIGNIETGSGGNNQPSVTQKTVNFIDYDGSILYSYSESEALVLTELPANPSHSGLTSQGWNWTLAQIKSQLTAMPGASVWVGQKYITDDGKTRIYCHFETEWLAPYLGLGVNGTVTVDWGDGSGTDTLIGTSLTTEQTVQHTYSDAGDYVITLTVESGSFDFFGTGNAAYILKKNTANTAYINRGYASAVRRIEMGANAGIGDYAFYACLKLTSITIPDGVTKIGNNAFSSCYTLASITIPEEVTNINTNVFSTCHSLTSITIPEGVTNIGVRAFSGCDSLTSITIPDKVTYIGTYAFNGCHSLTSITIPDGVTFISENAFNGCYSFTSITIPDGITLIGERAFYNCVSLTSITIPNGVTQIGSSAFSYCHSLTSITIPDGVTNISGNLFQDCYILASITIPEGVTNIGSYAFSGCYCFSEIHFLSSTPPKVTSSNVFTNVPTDCKIYVPAGSLEAYTSATRYPSSSTYTYIEE